MRRLAKVMIALIAGTACSKQDEPPQAPQAPQPPRAPVAQATPKAPAAPKPLSEPKGAIDRKSVEAAGQVVQQFGGLIEKNRIDEAGKLWRDAQDAAAFTKGLPRSTHLEIGQLGPTEGAAGSIYTTVPVVFYAGSFRRPADILLRRVNDVPGSTEAQRRWHIERIDWKDG